MSFSLLNENTKIKPISIDNIIPTKNSIIDEEYPLERPLFIYVNEDHMKLLPDLEKFINHLTSSDSIGPNGYLTKKGLLTKSTHDKFQ
jgi:phosphate transport system substrate-binding protein